MRRFWDIIVGPLIYKIKPKHIVEVGSEDGINTKHLLEYCVINNAKVSCIDPAPLYDVDSFKEKYGSKFEIIEKLSIDALPFLTDYDMILLDGDHNWYTIYNELKIIEETFKNKTFPLIIFHDISWPYGRRDLYYNPDTIPKEFLNPYAKKGMMPDEKELCETGGFNSNLFNAVDENTPKNGVLTGIEDFINETNLNLTFKKINAFHGLGILYICNEEIDSILEDILSQCDLLALLEKTYLKEIINYQIKDDILSEQKEIIDYLNDEIHKRDEVIFNQTEQIKNKNENIAKLHKAIKEKEKQIDKINTELKNIKNENKDLKNKLNGLLSSKSWKLTKPLRNISNSFKHK